MIIFSDFAGFKSILVATDKEGREYPIAAFGAASLSAGRLQELAAEIKEWRGLSDVKVVEVPAPKPIVYKPKAVVVAVAETLVNVETPPVATEIKAVA